MRGEAVTMSRAGDTAIAAEVQHRRRVAVDVILLLMRNGRILLRERVNTGYGDGAYEPPRGELADQETIVETAIRVASAEAGIAIRAENVSLAHVMHDVSGSGRIAFFLAVSGWPGAFSFRIWPHSLRISSISSLVSPGMAIVSASRSSISRQW